MLAVWVVQGVGWWVLLLPLCGGAVLQWCEGCAIYG
jgi:hypothetical protein